MVGRELTNQPGIRHRLAGSCRPAGGREDKGGNLRRFAQGIRRPATEFSGSIGLRRGEGEFRWIIAGLVSALTEGEAPQSLPSLETEPEHGATSLENFCKMVSDLLPSTSGHKGVLADIAKAAIQPATDALSEGVAALYNNHRKDNALTIETIKTQLEAAKWPNFAEVKAAK